MLRRFETLNQLIPNLFNNYGLIALRSGFVKTFMSATLDKKLNPELYRENLKAKIENEALNMAFHEFGVSNIEWDSKLMKF